MMNDYEKHSLVPIIQDLEKLFDIFNEHFFDNVLAPATIVTSSAGRKNALGWCTQWKAWTPYNKKDIHSVNPSAEERAILNEDDGYYEINVCAEHLNDAFDEVCTTLIHEMVHLYCLQFGIKDTSRNGVYHNTRFKETAEQHGLVISKDSRAGWTISELDYDARIFVESLNHDGFDLHRRNMKVKTEKKKPGMRKYVCPTCGAIIRATKEVAVSCIKCEQQFEYIIPEDEQQPQDTSLDPAETADLEEPLIPEIAAAFSELETEETANAS